MKTTTNFIKCAILIFAISFTSCSKDGDIGPIGPQGEQGIQGEQGEQGEQGPAGEDGEALGVPGPQGEQGEQGETGPAGEDGTDGTDGTNGEDGEDGEDGNANVVASSWLVADFPDNYSYSAATVTISDSRITQDVLNNYTVLGYFSFSDTFSEVYAIPFTEPLFRSFTMEQKMSIGEYKITEMGNPDTVGTIDPTDGFVRYLLIAPSYISFKSGENNMYTISGMKENGVNLSNYHEVMNYLGLE
ncbi:hypothetical protein [Maribacter litoralis]|uniref:hypothetical protein n=1 Tax=Maribacter litoralis TaxID=2059726 RepID=UPI003D2A6419